MSNWRKSGVEFHSLTEDQLGEWQAAGGYQLHEWDQFKIDLAGSMDVFARLEEAAGTRAGTTSTMPRIPGPARKRTGPSFPFPPV